MLYNPNWNAPNITVEGIAAWLRSKPTDGTYNWRNPWCSCLIGEWLGAERTDASRTLVLKQLMDSGHGDELYHIAETMPWTYGAALKRAENFMRDPLK